MLGRQSPQGELFRSDNLFADYVGRDSFYGFLSEHRHELFRDEEFAGLYKEGWGRPGVPPSQLCLALLLQAREGVSDEAAIEKTAYDLRWKVALGLGVEEKLCAKSTLQCFRAKLILHEAYEQIFQQSIDACRKRGILKKKKLELAIDTTPVFGRGAVKDTFNLISDQIRRVIEAAVKLKGHDREAVISESGLERHFSKSFKGEFDIDWNDPEEKRSVVSELVSDARSALEIAKSSLRGFAKGAERSRELREACDLLADLLLQDIDDDPDGNGPDIRRGTSRDRIISTTDPEMRHGRKSDSQTIQGYKSSVVVDTTSRVILSTDVRSANVGDNECATELVSEGSQRAELPVSRVIGDTAYGGLKTRDSFAELGIELVAKVPPGSKAKRGSFTVEDFKIDMERGVARCPAGKYSCSSHHNAERQRVQFRFSQKDCKHCPLRSSCTRSEKRAKTVTVVADYDLLRALRRKQRTKRFKRIYRRRCVAEHRIGRLVQLGIRQSRYLGIKKTAFQVAMAATVANLDLAIGRQATTHRSRRRLSTSLRLLDYETHRDRSGWTGPSSALAA